MHKQLLIYFAMSQFIMCSSVVQVALFEPPFSLLVDIFTPLDSEDVYLAGKLMPCQIVMCA